MYRNWFLYLSDIIEIRISLSCLQISMNRSVFKGEGANTFDFHTPKSLEIHSILAFDGKNNSISIG